jgi:hypothetical protein
MIADPQFNVLPATIGGSDPVLIDVCIDDLRFRVAAESETRSSVWPDVASDQIIRWRRGASRRSDKALRESMSAKQSKKVQQARHATFYSSVVNACGFVF